MKEYIKQLADIKKEWIPKHFFRHLWQARKEKVNYPIYDKWLFMSDKKRIEYMFHKMFADEYKACEHFVKVANRDFRDDSAVDKVREWKSWEAFSQSDETAKRTIMGIWKAEKSEVRT